MGCGASIDEGSSAVSGGRNQAAGSTRFNAKAGLSDNETNPALLSMHMLFATYDTDASGSIDATELLKLMKDVLEKTAKKKKKKPAASGGLGKDNWSNWEDEMLSSALTASSMSVIPTLRDVHEMMYAIGVEATQDELGQQTQLTIEESVFIDWMLGGMRRSQSERDAFGSENDVQKKMVAFLEALLKLVERNISGIQFMFSDQGEDGTFFFLVLNSLLRGPTSAHCKACVLGGDLGTPFLLSLILFIFGFPYVFLFYFR